MKYWLTKFSGAVLLSVITSVATFLAGVFILRILNPNAAGEFTLVTSVAGMVGMFGLFGQHSVINRLYSRSQVPFDWRRDLRTTIVYGSIIIFFVTIAVLFFYQFSWIELAFVISVGLLTVVIYASAFMLNSNRHYIFSTLLLRLPNALFIIPVILAMFGLMRLEVPGFLIWQVAIALFCGMAGIAGLLKFLPVGTKVIPWKEHREAVGFFLLMLTHLLIDPGLLVVAGYFVSPDHLAAFAGYMNLLRPFLLLWSILLQTLGVEYARNHRFPKRKLILGMWALAIPLFLVTWVVLPFLLDFLYSGKYNMVSSAALPIGLLGALLITETIPRSYIAGVADDRTLQRYIRDQIFVALVCLAIEIALILQLGVPGAAWGGCVLMFVRNINAYAYLFRMTNQAISSA
jgi:O-antigen/teichoic acid export membrane protein